MGLMGPGSNHLDGLAPGKQDPPAAPDQVHAARLAWLPRAPQGHLQAQPVRSDTLLSAVPALVGSGALTIADAPAHNEANEV